VPCGRPHLRFQFLLYFRSSHGELELLIRRACFLSGVLVLAVGLTACTRLARMPPGDSSLRVPPGTSAFQRDILADGTVTFDEYERAVLETISCTRAAGVDVGDLQLDDSGIFYDYRIYPRNMSDDEALAIHDECYSKNLSVVNLVWAEQNELSGTQREAELARVKSCLRDAGVDVDDDANAEDLMALLNSTPLEDRAVSCFLESPLFTR